MASSERECILLKASRRADVSALQKALIHPVPISSSVINAIRSRADETLLLLTVTANGNYFLATQLLLRTGADPTIRGHRTHYKTPLHEAARLGRTDVLQLLLQAGAHVDAVKSGDWTPLHIAAFAGHASAVDLLLRAGASPTARNRHHATPLLLAARSGDIDTVQHVLRCDIDIMQVCKNGRCAMHYAARAGWTHIVELLLSYDASADVVDKADMLPLYDAATAGMVETVQLLLEVSSVELVWKGDCAGQNVLHHAVLSKCLDVVHLVLNWCCFDRSRSEESFHERINIQDARGLSPLSLAMVNNYVHIAELLVKKGAVPETSHLEACMTPDGKTDIGQAVMTALEERQTG